jgi:hypothetical protein
VGYAVGIDFVYFWLTVHLTHCEVAGVQVWQANISTIPGY